MKKIVYLLLCSFIFCTAGFANNKIPILTTSEGGNGPDVAFPDSECTIRIPYIQTGHIYVANLIATKSGEYSLPANAPDIYVELYVQDENGVPGIDRINVTDAEWELVGDFGSENVSIYSAPFQLSTSLVTSCPVDEETITSYLELVTYSEFLGMYVPYPICFHNEEGELFPCEVFEDVPCPGGLCLVDQTIQVDGGIPSPYDCRTCDSGQSQLLLGNGGSSLRTSEVEEIPVEAFECNVVSNPFSDQLNINWSNGGTAPMQLQVFGATGQLIESLTVNGTVGNRAMDSAHWPKGMYFLVATQGDQRETIKLIKN